MRREHDSKAAGGELGVFLTAVGPGIQKDLDFTTARSIAHEVAMIKAAILYADHVTIASPMREANVGSYSVSRRLKSD